MRTGQGAVAARTAAVNHLKALIVSAPKIRARTARPHQRCPDCLLREVTEVQPQLVELPGAGPISAAQVLISWSHPGRLRSEAAFAALAGAAPIPASSGLTNRHRLNRGGDRQLNRALHTI
jgi:transposase